MFKFVFVFALAICAANAGVIGLGHGGLVGHVAVAHGATSYANSNLVALHPTPVVVAHAAPVHVAHAPIAIGLGLGHGGLLH